MTSASRRDLLLGALFLSGAAGLAYELVWSRHLALLLGHGGYARVVVVALYLGGMAGGAVLAGRLTAGIRHPLRVFAWIEGLLALVGLLFLPVFSRVSALVYGSILPALPDAAAGVVPWLIAGLLVLPQAVLLGATIPLATVGLMRIFHEEAGATVADAYLWSALGGAVGVLATGFALEPLLGSGGSLIAAAAANVTAGGVALAVGRRKGSPVRIEAVGLERRELLALVLVGAFLTAVASSVYAIGWTRMLSFVMGGSAHSSELVLSALVLGVAVGARSIRGRLATPRPLTVLGVVQWLMGFMALATLPLYILSFDFVAALVSDLPPNGSGYLVFTVGRYLVALLVVLPSAAMAGAALPLMTAVLLRGRASERAVAWVFGAGALGSVAGVVAGALILLPLLGPRDTLLAGAVLAMVLGVVFLRLARSRKADPVTGGGARAPGGSRAWAWAAGATAVVCVLVPLTLRFDRALLTGGVFRSGETPDESTREVLFYDHGRTASVGVHVLDERETVVLTSNGRRDASLPFRWLRAAAGTDQPREPLRDDDAAARTLAAATLMAHRPDGGHVVSVGHGSGMSAAAFLTNPAVERVVTVEIEPAVVRGSRSFEPANAKVFEDRRHAFVLDHARVHLARSGPPIDLLLSVPAKPWVRGVGSLFAQEFYELARGRLSEGGLFGQRLHLHEMSDRHLTGVLAALHRVFPDYRAYVVGPGDLLVVAGERVPDPDWGVFRLPELEAHLAHLPPITVGAASTLEVFRRSDLAPLLDDPSLEAERDRRPALESGAERARFLGEMAAGGEGLANDRFDLPAALGGRQRVPPDQYFVPPVWTVLPVENSARASWMRHGGGRTITDPVPFAEWEGAYLQYVVFTSRIERDPPPGDWQGWATQFIEVEETLHRETAGWADPAYYEAVRDFMDRTSAPDPARRVVDFFHGLAAWDFDEAAAALDTLEGSWRDLLPGETLLTGGVLAYLKVGRSRAAAALLEEAEARTRLRPDDLRLRLMGALVERASEA